MTGSFSLPQGCWGELLSLLSLGQKDPVPCGSMLLSLLSLMENEGCLVDGGCSSLRGGKLLRIAKKKRGQAVCVRIVIYPLVFFIVQMFTR